jgi:eukaryotic-like serine/threonine-protein kinase
MPGPRIIGRYALYGEIAAGGMATVHLGRLIGSGGVHRIVAIKCLHAHFAKDPEFVKMFLDEARVAARIHHPNVVSLLDFLALEGELFLVMDYVQGEALSKLVTSAKRAQEHVPRNVVASVMTGALHGLHAAHTARSAQGEPLDIVHRDVSPQNILVGVDGVARVLDFGVAKAAGRLQTTREGQIKGKIRYMAPEQLRSEAVDRRADIYSAGVVLWEILTGRRLFPGDNEGAVLTKILLGKKQPPSALVADLPRAWDEITMKALDPDPEKRFATAEAMADAIESLVGVASPRVVRDWVVARASESLTARQAAVEQVERDGDPTLAQAELEPLREAATPASQPSATSLFSPADSRDSISPVPRGIAGPRAGAGRTAQVAVALGALAVVGVAALLVRGSATRDTEAGALAPAVAKAPTSSPIASASTPVVSPATTAAAPEESAAAASSTGDSSARPPPPPPPRQGPKAAPRPAAKGANCASPFVIDANGVKRVKRECL